jgi:mannose-1-phosphate guanylyltransferase/mannose-6-phosphate isomerase
MWGVSVMKVLVLAGGSGTRLWPLSRKNYPKQFLRLTGDQSLLQQTVRRLLHVVSQDDIVVMTNSEYKFHVLSDLGGLFDTQYTLRHAPGSMLLDRIILEPACRNTAPAIALGAKYCLDRLGCDKKDVLFISPSDHVISTNEQFGEYVRKAEKVAKEGYIVTFGIKPTRPETGYGYIKTVSSKEYAVSTKQKEDFKKTCYHVEKFTEKPNPETAKKYVEEGNYYWNSGMFAFSIGTIIDEFRKHEPVIYEMFGSSYDEAMRRYPQMPEISIDYALMEKSDRVVTLPMDIYWNDIGSWDSIYELLERDEKGNIKTGDVITMDTSDTMVIGSKRLITTIGLEDCLIIETDDAILIARKGQAQKVKDIVEHLTKENRKEASEHVTTYRPWGSYTVLEEEERYKIKRIVVNPLERLSLQMHHHRSEHWVVVRGTAKVTIGELEKLVHENESAYVPKSTLHRLENPGKVALEMIEVQNGEYVGEDDIVRVDDVYGRHEKKIEVAGKRKKSKKPKKPAKPKKTKKPKKKSK